MANTVDSDQAVENGKNVDPDQTVTENDSENLTLITLLRMAGSVDSDQTAENGKQCRLCSNWEWPTV